MANTITLAHLSDVHLSPLAGFTVRHWNVKRGLGYLNWQRGRRHVHSAAVLDRLIADMRLAAPDHIAVTGDLVNLGLPAEYEKAVRWLERLGDGAGVTVVPGNHDIYTHLGSDPGVRRWLAYMSPDDWGRSLMPPAGDGFPFVRRLGPAALIGLNSAVPTPPFVAAGRLGRAQLDRLGLVLRRAAEAGLIRVVLIHHPPLPGQAPPRRALWDAADLEAVLMREGADLVLHGHNHRDMVVSRQTSHGQMLVVGIASGSAGRRHHGEPLARYNLFRLSRDLRRPMIELHGRGLMEPGGPIVDLERQVLMPRSAAAAEQP